jgi:hypothetical protein
MDLDGTILERGLLTIRHDDAQNSQAIYDWVKNHEVHLQLSLAAYGLPTTAAGYPGQLPPTGRRPS